jgi:hypothetical protein
MPELPFLSAIMQLTATDGTVIASNLPCQIDTVNIPINMEVQQDVPTDWFDLFSVNWTSPVPIRGNYFVDQATGAKYAVFGRAAVYIDHLEVRVALPLGATP